MNSVPICRRFAAAALACGLFFVPVGRAEASGGFFDVPDGAWYADKVSYVSAHGLMKGTGGGAFSPGVAMTRGMMTAVLYRIAGSPAGPGGTGGFTDVSAGAWYADAVAWAVSAGVVGGYGNGTFGPNDVITREQMTAMLWRFAGRPAAESGEDFADEGAISSWASGAVDWARAVELMVGRGENRFDSRGTTTRAEAAALLARYHQQEVGGGTVPAPVAPPGTPPCANARPHAGTDPGADPGTHTGAYSRAYSRTHPRTHPHPRCQFPQWV